MSTITAADLLAKQREVKQLEAAQTHAWNAIGEARREVEKRQDEYNEARWRTEQAVDELLEMENTVQTSPDKETPDE